MNWMKDNDLFEVVGASVFLGYIVLALLLTVFLCLQLLSAFQSLPQGFAGRSDRQRQFNVFLLLAGLSFGVLSYHMLTFLVESYVGWLSERNVEVPYGQLEKFRLLVPHNEPTILNLWSWMKTTSLFRDFANNALAPGEHFWWTQQALYGAMIFNVYMSIKGSRKQIKHLWAYSMISQVLPYSLAQNLFAIALLITPKPQKGQRPGTLPLIPLLVSVVPYLCFVQGLPHLVGSPYLMHCIVLTRLFLLSPFVVVSNYRHESTLKAQVDLQAWKDDVSLVSVISLYALGLFGFRTLFILGGNQFNFFRLGFALSENPAVSALAYDYILSVVSAGYWFRSAQSISDHDLEPEK